MEFSYLLRGFIIGFSIAAPVGPIGILCIRATLANGRLAGFVSGLGAASADAIYGCIAGFGLTFISNLLVTHSVGLRLGGGLFLCYLGVKTAIASPPANLKLTSETRTPKTLAKHYFSILFLTLTNPLTILSFVTIFAGLGLASATGGYLSAGVLVFGVFLGSGTWWFLLSSSVSWFRHKLTPTGLTWINRLAGIVIIALGLVALLGVRG